MIHCTQEARVSNCTTRVGILPRIFSVDHNLASNLPLSIKSGLRNTFPRIPACCQIHQVPVKFNAIAHHNPTTSTTTIRGYRRDRDDLFSTTANGLSGNATTQGPSLATPSITYTWLDYRSPYAMIIHADRRIKDAARTSRI